MRCGGLLSSTGDGGGVETGAAPDRARDGAGSEPGAGPPLGADLGARPSLGADLGSVSDAA